MLAILFLRLSILGDGFVTYLLFLSIDPSAAIS